MTARFECSLAKVFADLRLQIEQDVKTRNDVRTDREKQRGRFEITATVGDSFMVLLSEDANRAVTFRLLQDSITATGTNGQIVKGTPTISDDGECRLKVDGRELDQWQFRKRALESLFF